MTKQYKILLIGVRKDIAQEIAELIVQFISEKAIIHSENRKGAIRSVISHLPSLVITEPGTSVDSSLDLIHELRTNKSTLKIPLLLVLEHGTDNQLLQGAYDAGVHGFLTMQEDRIGWAATIRNALNSIVTSDDAGPEQSLDNMFRNIVEDAPEPIFIQTEMNFSYLNPAACKLFGVESASTLIGTPVMDRFHPDFHKLIWSRIKQINEDKEQVNKLVEIKALRLNGDEVWVETVGEPITYNQKHGGLVFVRDITIRKQSKEMLQESEDKWQFALEGAGDGVWDWDYASGKVIFSDQWKRMLGFEPGEIGNQLSEWEKRVHPDDMAGTMEDLQNHLQGRTDVYMNEHRLKCKDGSYKWILDRGKVLRRDKDGNPVRVIGIHTDIHEKKLVEKELETTRFGIDHAEIGVYQVSESGDILYVNQYAARNLGYTQEELTGKSVFDIAPTFDKAAFRKHRAITRKKGYRTFISVHKRKDGTEFPVEITVNYFKFNNRELSFSFAKDISEQVKAIEKLQKSEMRFRLLAESAPIGILIGDKDMNVVYLSNRFTQILGYEKEDIRNIDDWYKQAYPDEVVRRKIKRRWGQALVKARKGEYEVNPMEFSVTCKDGEVKDVEFRISSSGGLDFVILNDISERKRVESELRKLKDNLAIQVEQKTAELMKRIGELERFHQATIDREFRIKELRDELKIFQSKK
ncbi:MAG: PAS domain S-box protein [Bacteroidales bacterium]